MNPTTLPRRIRQALGRLRRLWRNRRFLDGLLLDGHAHFLQFAPPGHFYSPVPNATADPVDASVTTLPGIVLNVPRQLETVNALAGFYAELPFPETPATGHRFHLDNPYFAGGDAIILYGMLRWLAPQRVIEVGSGYSSAAMLDVADRFPEVSSTFTFIEPHPESLHALLGKEDLARHKVLVTEVQRVGLEPFLALAASDLLFIDSSHVLKTASDVHFLLFDVLPRLQPGVVVHFHDIPWPFDYPQIWLRQGRAWNEAYALRAFLQFNEVFEILCFNAYLARHHRELLSARMPRVLTPPSRAPTLGNSSLWLRKRT